MPKKLSSILQYTVMGVLIFFIVMNLWKRFNVPDVEFNAMPLTTLAGETISFDHFEGKPVFVNFFATWCGPCVKEMPSIEEAYNELADEGMHFVIISDEPIQKIKDYKEKFDYPMTFLHMPDNSAKYGVSSLPTCFVLNSKGEAEIKRIGAHNWSSTKSLKKLRQIMES